MGKNKKQKKNSRSNADDRTDLIERINMENERFCTYYKAQNILSDDEWEVFMDALRQHLPTTFRVTGSRQLAQTLNETIKSNHVPKLSNVIFEGQKIPPPVQLPWYPDGMAWQFNVPKKVLRKSLEFKNFHSFLVFETEVGNISRQEAVSMLPPLFLNVKPHHKVLDMCAAPGSKTAQILEAIHAHDTISSTSIPPGLVIANDSDNKRTHLLIHQSARLPSPALMVTNLDASNYPAIRIPVDKKASDAKLGQLLFDRILCDVPCSGDGTIRKNVGIWKSWRPGDGNGLHSLQVRILQRAMKLLKNNGRIVYSTCSLNPVENEAVIAEALRVNQDFYLVDISAEMPQLVRRPGLTTWRPTIDHSGAMKYNSFEDFKQSSSGDHLKVKLTEGHWPPVNAEALDLHRCIRIYPHLQDTGGFFIAVLEKRRDDTSNPNIKDVKRKEYDGQHLPEPKKTKVAEEVDNHTRSPVISVDIGEKDKEAQLHSDPAKNSVVGSFKENPYTFLSPDDPILRACIERLNLTPEFPSSNILVRNPEGEAVRSLYLANDIVRSIIENNDFARIRLTGAGTKVLSKQDSGKGTDAQYRILGEGLPVIKPYIDPTTFITGDMSTLKTLIESYYPLCSTFDEPFKGTITTRPIGSHIVRFPPTQLDGASLSHELFVPIWKSNVSLALMIDKKAKRALSVRLYGSDLSDSGKDFVKHSGGVVKNKIEDESL